MTEYRNNRWMEPWELRELSKEGRAPRRHFCVPAEGEKWLAVPAGSATFLGLESGRSVTVTLELSDDPPSVLTSAVTVRYPEGQSLTRRDLADLPLGFFADETMANLGHVVDANHRHAGDGMILDRALEQAREGHVRRGRPPAIGPKELERAAAAYTKALSQGQGTTKAVAHTLGVSASTARKRVMAARAAGLLPPARSTRPRASGE